MSLRSKVGLALAAVAAGFLGGCSNGLRDFPDKTSSKYLISKTSVDLDKFDFDSAISDISGPLAAMPTNEEVVHLATSAYAGRAGLRVIDMTASLITGLSGTKGIFHVFAEFYPGSAAQDLTDMDTAHSIIKNYGNTAADRSCRMNFLALYVYYSRIGVYLNNAALDATANTLSSSFKACSLSKLPSATVDVVMTSLSRVIDTMTELGSCGSSSFPSISLPVSLPADAYPCSSYEAAGIPATAQAIACATVRTLISVNPAEATAIGLPFGPGFGTGEGTCLTGIIP